MSSIFRTLLHLHWTPIFTASLDLTALDPYGDQNYYILVLNRMFYVILLAKYSKTWQIRYLT